MEPSWVLQWSLAVFFTLLELSIIILIWLGVSKRWRGINLEKLISEQDGAASLSRFQFLLFTFVVASAYIVLAFHNVQAGNNLPAIPGEVLGLIGISGGSYVVSKGIQKTSEQKDASAPPGRFVR